MKQNLSSFGIEDNENKNATQTAQPDDGVVQRLKNCVTFDIWLNNAPIISIIKALLSKDYVLIQGRDLRWDR